ncbi:hypothetical protein TruAng_006638 [Truncatella angustata]|nr:hypothetical protein TruAng_006638 [Truncatella angustata]
MQQEATKAGVSGIRSNRELQQTEQQHDHTRSTRSTGSAELVKPVKRCQPVQLAQLVKELGDTDNDLSAEVDTEEKRGKEEEEETEAEAEEEEEAAQEIEEEKEDPNSPWVDMEPDTPDTVEVGTSMPTPRQVAHNPVTTFVSRQGSDWIVVSQVTSNDRSEVEHVAAKWMAHRLRPFSVDMRPLLPETCYDVAMSKPGHVLVLMPEDDVHVSPELAASWLNTHTTRTSKSRSLRYFSPSQRPMSTNMWRWTGVLLWSEWR